MRILTIPLAFLIGALASRYAAMLVPQRFTIDMAQPLPVVTTWGPAGVLPIVILLVTVGVATFAYAASLRVAPPRRITLLCAAATMAAGFLWIPLFSSDTYAYEAYGELARLGFNPYAVISPPPGNALLAAAVWQWRPAIPPCVYGAGFVWIAQMLVTFTHTFPPAITLDAFRILSCACLLACGAMIGRREAFFLSCNPVAIWGAIEGHNDTIMLLVVLAGVTMSTSYARIGATIATLGALIKAPAIAAGAALGIQGLIERRSFSATTGFLLGCAILAVALAPMLEGIGSGVASHGSYAPAASVQALAWPIAALLAIFVLLRLRTATTWMDRFCIVALAAWLAIPNPYPWYSIWILPIAAFATDRRLATCAIAVSCAAMLRYIPDAIGAPTQAGALALGLIATLAYLPLFSRAIISRS